MKGFSAVLASCLTALKEEGLTAFEELRARWPKRLAAWFEKQLRNCRTP